MECGLVLNQRQAEQCLCPYIGGRFLSSPQPSVGRIRPQWRCMHRFKQRSPEQGLDKESCRLTLFIVSRIDGQSIPIIGRTPDKTMSANSEEAKSVSNETEASNDSNVKRYNITMDKDHHDKVVKFVNDRGTTFSSFVRRAVEARRHRLENDDVAREFQPLLDEIESVGEGVENVAPLLDELRSLVEEQDDQKEPDTTTLGTVAPSDKMAKQVFSHINKMGSATIPELVEKTSLDRPTVRGVIARLESDFAIEELEEDGGVPAWEVK